MNIREQFLKMKEEAKKLEKKFGWITIPVFLYKKEKNKYSKAPLIQWKEVVNEPFETRWGDYIISIAEKKAKVYEDKDPNIGIAVITGKPSHLTVIDFDDPTQYFTIKNEIDTIKQETRRGGHLFFKYDPEIKTQVNKKLNMDVRNDGAFIVVAPTKGYTMTGEELKEIPDWLKSKLQTSQVQKNLPIKDIKISIKNLDNLVKIVNEAYHQKRLDGYGVDLFLSGLAYYGIDEKEIHRIAREIFQEEYDQKRTDYMINRGIDFRNSGKLPIFFSIFREIGKDWKTRQKIKESINKEIVDELSEKLKEKFGININGVSLKGEEIRDMIINTKNFVANNELYDQSGKKIKCEIKTFGAINPEKYYKVKIINK
uniref:bifunctional DNA primase/polymerase n=1 Tax=Desulfurobacterium sp. TaxID=2004706 RepID=UPI0026263886